MRCALVFLGVLCALLALAPASTATLYAIQGPGEASGFQVATINIVSGKQTQVGLDIPTALNLYQEVTVDSKNNILYALLFVRFPFPSLSRSVFAITWCMLSINHLCARAMGAEAVPFLNNM